MNCKKCKAKIDNFEVYCPKCGVPTGIVKEKMSAFKTFSEVYNKYKGNQTKHFSMSLFAVLYCIIPLVGIKMLFNQFAGEYNNLIMYGLLLLVSTLFIPFIIIPLAKKNDYYSVNSQAQEYKESLKYYPKFFLLSIISALYLIALRYICQGDPILNLVHLVMVFYGFAIVMPVPLLIVDKNLSVKDALRLSYKSGLYTYRWQCFFMTLIIGVINLPGFLMTFYSYRLTAYNEVSAWVFSIILFLLASAYCFVAFPLSWQLIKDLYRKFDENHSFDKIAEKTNME